MTKNNIFHQQHLLFSLVVLYFCIYHLERQENLYYPSCSRDYNADDDKTDDEYDDDGEFVVLTVICFFSTCVFLFFCEILSKIVFMYGSFCLRLMLPYAGGSNSLNKVISREKITLNTI